MKLKQGDIINCKLKWQSDKYDLLPATVEKVFKDGRVRVVWRHTDKFFSKPPRITTWPENLIIENKQELTFI